MQSGRLTCFVSLLSLFHERLHNLKGKDYTCLSLRLQLTLLLTQTDCRVLCWVLGNRERKKTSLQGICNLGIEEEGGDKTITWTVSLSDTYFFLGFVFFVPFDSLHLLPGILSTFTFVSSFDNFGSELIGKENMSFSNLLFGPWH